MKITVSNLILTTLAWLALSMIISCAKLTIRDKTVCANGPGGLAACDNIYTSNQVILTQPQWDSIRVGWLCVSPNDWAEMKVEIQTACSMVKCSYEQIQQLNSIFQKIQNLPSTMP